MPYYYEVIPLSQINEGLTYQSDEQIDLGSIVQIPLRKKTATGVILSETKVEDITFDVKKILKIKQTYALPINQENLNFYQYLSSHYFIDLGMVYKMAIQQYPDTQLKSFLSYKGKTFSSQKDLTNTFKLKPKQFKELLDSKEISSTFKNFLFHQMQKEIKLNREQQKIFDDIWQHKKQGFKTHLIDGVTGSGKTELYLKLIEETLVQGGQSLVLLPEIALTEEWTKRFKSYFGCEPFVWHSKQTRSQKSRILQSLLKGEPCVIVGARSAVLLPFENLQLLICDEEHDSSYKQEEGPRYHARDMAIYKAKCSQCICTLVSASPSLESLYNSENQKITSHQLAHQFHQTELPQISIIDMNIHRPSSKSWISKDVYDETMSVLKNKGQVLFFLNRRGYAPTKICVSCHTAIQCQHCAVNLVYHKKIDRLICHHCSSFYDSQQICKMCSSDKFVSLGIGLERLQEEVMRLFPGYQSQVFSSDTLSSKKNKKLMMEKIFEQETNLLIGSQIIGKSFHFPNLKLVNIIDGDSSLFSPDFRAMEKTYQLLQQVAGRSGREGERGKVLIQTYSPQHPIFQSIKDQNRENFIKNELARRKQSHLPPYAKIAQLQLVHPNYPELRSICLEVLETSKKLQLGVLGPTPSLIPYKKNHYQENFYFKETSYAQLSSKISKLLSQLSPKNKRFLHIDIDPLSIA
jgi:primosomal protein N' (replication factor Y)